MIFYEILFLSLLDTFLSNVIEREIEQEKDISRQILCIQREREGEKRERKMNFFNLNGKNYSS